MKRLWIMPMLAAALMISITAYAESTEPQESEQVLESQEDQESQEADSDMMEQRQPGERDGERPDGVQNNGQNGGPDGVQNNGQNGGPDGGRGGQGGQGGGMANQSSEPDEVLQAILDEVQDKYQLLTFTDLI